MPRKSHPWFRKSDGCWYIKIGGKAEKLARGRKNREAAIRRWHEIVAERAANRATGDPEQTVASVIDVYLSHSKRHYSPESYANRRRYLQLFAEAHGFRSVCECRPMHLTQWLDANPQWKSDWTRSNAVRIVHRAFNWAVQQGLTQLNPYRGVSQRPGQRRRPMTEDEFRILLRATAPKSPNGLKRHRSRPTPGGRFRQVLLFLRYTGARPSEMSHLTWQDVDLERGVIVLWRHKTSKTQRLPRPRVIQLVPLVVKLLKCLKHQKPIGRERVFVTSHGTPWCRSNLSLRLSRLRMRAGLTDAVKLYGIRHQFGTQSIINGVDIKTLSELMGHTTTRMTEHYLHLAGQQEHLAAAMQRAVSPRRDT